MPMQPPAPASGLAVVAEDVAGDGTQFVAQPAGEREQQVLGARVACGWTVRIPSGRVSPGWSFAALRRRAIAPPGGP